MSVYPPPPPPEMHRNERGNEKRGASEIRNTGMFALRVTVAEIKSLLLALCVFAG